MRLEVRRFVSVDGDLFQLWLVRFRSAQLSPSVSVVLTLCPSLCHCHCISH